MTELERIKSNLEIELVKSSSPELIQDALRAIESLEWTNQQLAKENKRKLKENWKKSIERVFKIASSNAIKISDSKENTDEPVIPVSKLKQVCEEQLERGDTL